MEQNKYEKTIKKSLLKSISGEFELGTILLLNLSNSGISDLGCLGDCLQLVSVNLSQNFITSLYALASLVNLTELDVSCNRVSSLEGIQTLEKLHTLNVAGNLLQSVEVLWNISNLGALRSLTLRRSDGSNPLFECCLNYKHRVLTILPGIKILDDQCIRGNGGEEYSLCEEMVAEIEALKQSKLVTTEIEDSCSNWIPDGFWLINCDNSMDEHYEEKSFEDMLADCQRLVEQSDDLISRWNNTPAPLHD